MKTTHPPLSTRLYAAAAKAPTCQSSATAEQEPEQQHRPGWPRRTAGGPTEGSEGLAAASNPLLVQKSDIGVSYTHMVIKLVLFLRNQTVCIQAPAATSAFLQCLTLASPDYTYLLPAASRCLRGTGTTVLELEQH